MAIAYSIQADVWTEIRALLFGSKAGFEKHQGTSFQKSRPSTKSQQGEVFS